ncbi:hypothetical protein QO010_000136 [Caulobacter ginsengisoli]|uniref:Porin n=1 Tax=Caulobacter ginsengisoli TaxID=400775 RepID=A0ABU0IML0_9CAUL|nr:hypothetical protein [Caulobacter ginsengisoli]MDQ0462388.1 hypothetical protein [Caulobacter ginsengisoli]
MKRAVSRLGLCAAVAAISLTALPAQAAEPAPDLATLQQEIAQMRADYEARISALEAKLAQAQAAAPAAVPTDTADASADATPPAGSEDQSPPVDEASAEPVAAPTANGNAQNPGVSVVLNGNYFADSRDPAASRIAGFPLGDEAGPPVRGFSLAESEITLAANVDPYMSANLTVSFDGQGAADVEEAYIQSTALPGGFTLKGGRFFSGIGYLNERHAHNWSFIDMPLPYRALLGGQLGDDGVQIRWLAPVGMFLEFGAEAYRGDSFPAGGAASRGAGTQTVFVHTGGDFNDSWSWLGALSYVRAKSDGRETFDPINGLDSFTGDTKLGIVSGVLKWAPGGNVVQRNLVLSGEYFFGNEKGQFNGLNADLDRSGWYAQAVYQFRPRWSAGLRYSRMSAGDVPFALAGSTLDDLGHNAWNASALVEYDSSEFGRFRLEYTRDEGDLNAGDQLWLQYTVVYGPHGAHRY